MHAGGDVIIGVFWTLFKSSDTHILSLLRYKAFPLYQLNTEQLQIQHHKHWPAKPKAMFDSVKVFTSKKGEFIFGKKGCKEFLVRCWGDNLPWWGCRQCKLWNDKIVPLLHKPIQHKRMWPTRKRTLQECKTALTSQFVNSESSCLSLLLSWSQNIYRKIRLFFFIKSYVQKSA